jgi:hypothetical protein
MSELALRRFMALFRGNGRSVGRWHPDRPKDKQSVTDQREPTPQDFDDHLLGKVGVGVVPIRDDGTCFWGAIDIDNHGQTEDIDIVEVERRVLEQSLPLVPVRSKSGGVHLYMFASEPVKAEHVRELLKRWAKGLKVEGVDCIYPKQSRLALDSDGKRAFGNWINLPYYDADDTVRYAVSNGKPLNLDGFLDTAEGRAVTAQEVQRLFGEDLSQMPPCLQARLRDGGFIEGERNDGVYQVAVFCRKRDPDNAREASHDLSVRFMPNAPLSFKERDKTIRSAMGRTYNYKCSSFKDVCDREACRKLKFGISEAEYEAMASRATMPTFTGLTKYHNTEPVRFDIELMQGEVNRKIEGLQIEQLSNINEFRKVVMEKTHVVLPRLKASEWDAILTDLFANVKIDEIPEDATPEGLTKMRLHEFCRKADLSSPGDDHKDREVLQRGLPVVQLHEERRVVMFRHADFVAHLQRSKTDAIKNKDLWFKASRYMRVDNTRIRVGKQTISVWYLPVDELQEESNQPRDFTPEY